MENLNLAEAFAKFGGKAANRLHTLSAMAADGALILSCTANHFRHPTRGVLRYEHRLSSESDHRAEAESLGQHLTLARDAGLPVRMVVIHGTAEPTGKITRNIHVRTDLVGKVVEFDGDHFIVDFVRAGEAVSPVARAARRT